MMMIVALLVAGLVLLIAEIMLPGAVMGILGLGCIATGLVLSFAHGALVGGICTAAVAVAGLIGLWMWIKFFPNSRIGHRMFLRKTAKAWHGWEVQNSTLLGQAGMAQTLLRPVGVAQINGQRVDVITRGETIEAGQPLTVIHVEGNRIVVALAAPAAAVPGATAGVPAPPRA